MMRLRLYSGLLRCAIAALCLTALTPKEARADEIPGYLYTYVENDERYNDTIFSLDAYKPIGNNNSRFRPYVDVLSTQDSRTAGGDVPQIYADNYALGALGFQYTTTTGLRAFVQGGVSSQLGAVAAVPSGGDLRYGLQQYREWGGADAKSPYYGNLYSSATYYSRYSDGIFYNELEYGRVASHWLPEIFVRGVLNLDTRTFYYSNLAEMVVGARFHPFGTHGPALSLEQVAGTYLRNAVLPADTSQTYHDFRPTISYGVNL